MTFRVSAGIYPRTIDLTDSVQSLATSVGAACVGLTQGPVGPFVITGGYDQFVSYYGAGDASYSTAHFYLKEFLRESTACIVNRVVNTDARWGGRSYFNDSTTRTLNMGFTPGTIGDYNTISQQVQLITLSNKFVTSNSATITVAGDGNAGSTATSNFATDSNTTLANWATAIQVKLDAIGTGGLAKVYDEFTGPDQRQVMIVTFAAAWASGSYQATYTVDGSGSNVNVSFTTDNDTTLGAIATAISAISGLTAVVLPGSGGAGTARQIQVTANNAGPTRFVVSAVTSTVSVTHTNTQAGGGVYDDRTIVVFSPPNHTIQLSSGSVTGGTSQPTVTIQTNTDLFDVYAENPSENLNNIGTKISDLDVGVQNRWTLTFSQALVTANSFTCQIADKNNTLYNVGPVVFGTDSDTTMAAIATAISSALTSIGTGGSATVTQVAGSVSNDRVITIIAPIAGQDIVVQSPLVTGGTSQPVVTAANILAGITPKYTFKLSVYSKTDTSRAAEFWTVSLTNQTDGNGNQLFMESVINSGPLQSKYIRVRVNTANTSPRVLNVDSSINWLVGGAKGSVPTNAQLATAWGVLADRSKYTCQILINCGYTDVSVQQAMAACAESRRDAHAILDMPSSSQSDSGTSEVNYRRYTLNINSRYASIYTPDVEVLDPVTGEILWMGQSGHQAARYAFTDRNDGIYRSPGGQDNGTLSNVRRLRKVYNEGARDQLEPAGINYVYNYGAGPVTMTGLTLYDPNSAFVEVPISRMVSAVEATVVDSLYRYLQKPLDEVTRYRVVQQISNFLEPIKNDRGMKDYKVVMDSKNNPPGLENAGFGVVSVIIIPVHALRGIRVNMILANNFADVEEVEFDPRGG